MDLVRVRNLGYSYSNGGVQSHSGPPQSMVTTDFGCQRVLSFSDLIKL